MKTLSTFVLLSVFAINVLAQTKNEQQVIDADTHLNELILKNNAEEAKALYADDFVLTTSGGGKKYKSDMVTEIGNAENLKLSINETSKISVRLIEDTAVLTGVLHQKGIYKGNAFDVWMLVTDTWVYTADGWKILAGHASVIDQAKISSLN